jgi:hypothetical protein
MQIGPKNLPVRRQSQPYEPERRRHVSSSGATMLSLSLLSYLPLVLDNERASFTMSFSFSVGDFIAAIELVNKFRKEFVDEYVI